MKKALKGALLSALVFPGCGQFFLKRYIRGTALVLATLAGLMLIVLKSAQEALAILEQINLQGASLNIEALSRMTEKASSLSSNPTIEATAAALVLCWVVGVIDAYLVGRKMDR